MSSGNTEVEVVVSARRGTPAGELLEQIAALHTRRTHVNVTWNSDVACGEVVRHRKDENPELPWKEIDKQRLILRFAEEKNCRGVWLDAAPTKQVKPIRLIPRKRTILVRSNISPQLIPYYARQVLALSRSFAEKTIE